MRWRRATHPTVEPRSGHAGEPEFAQRHPRARQDDGRPASSRRWHLATMDRELRDAASAIARDLRLECDLGRSTNSRRRDLTRAVSAAVRAAAQALGYSHREMVSGAGHDAIYVARVAPTAMIFVPVRMASATTRSRTPVPSTSRRGPTCCCTRCLRAHLVRRHAFLRQLLDGGGILREMREPHAAQHVRSLGELDVGVADDLDPVPPGSRNPGRGREVSMPASASAFLTASLSSTTRPK